MDVVFSFKKEKGKNNHKMDEIMSEESLSCSKNLKQNLIVNIKNCLETYTKRLKLKLSTNL